MTDTHTNAHTDFCRTSRREIAAEMNIYAREDRTAEKFWADDVSCMCDGGHEAREAAAYADTAITKTVTLISCANMGASGILVRGKQIEDDWQVHAEGCGDLKEMQRIFGRFDRDAFQTFDNFDAARDNFNAEMGAGGSAGFTAEEGGWDFDRDVTVKPCCK